MENVLKRETETKFHIISRVVASEPTLEQLAKPEKPPSLTQ